jgi:plasmid stabilization system protein ParE
VHRLSRQARSDLDKIWFYIAKESGSEALADRHGDAITDRFYLLAEHPRIAMTISAAEHGVSRWGTTS